MHLQLRTCTVRAWRLDDLEPLVRHANNRNISVHLRDRFPYPYTVHHGRDFLAYATQQTTPTVWAIEVDGEAAGGVGLVRLGDIERVSAEIGYWLGESFWRRGVMTEVVTALTAEAWRDADLQRIFALPFADNTASVRVLEKAGYALEGRLRRSAIKDGVIRDQLMYARYRDLP